MEGDDLRNVGLKITAPRLKMLAFLERSQDRHLTAEEIYRELVDAGEEIGLATVYRVLTQFEAAGLVDRHHFEGDQAVFELASEKHHDHIVCIHCGHVEEFFDKVIEDRQHKIAEEYGFSLKDHALTLYGECNLSSCNKSRI